MIDRHTGQPALWERIAIFAFGVTFVTVLLVLAIGYPYPTPYQYTVFRIVLALSASAVATLLSGFLIVKIPGLAKAGGALAVFLIVYFYSPAALVVNNLGTVQQNMTDKQYASAEKSLEAILAISPNYPEAHNLLGHIYWKKMRVEEARTRFAAAADFGTGHDKDRYLFNVAASDMVLGKYQEAAEMFEKLHKRDPKDTSTMYNLAIAKGQSGQYDEARSLFANLFNAGQTNGKDYRSRAKLQLGVLDILERRDNGLVDATAHFRDAVFLDRALDMFFLRCSAFVDAEELSVEGRVIDGIADTPTYRQFRQDLSGGRRCPSLVAS